jgi:hypothetical protein
MSYSRRQLEAFGEPFGDSATRREGGRTIYGSGGGSGGGGDSRTVQDLPEWAKPYAKQTLGMAEGLTTTKTPRVDAQGQPVMDPDTGKQYMDITGPAKYQPRPGGTDVPGADPLQQQAYRGIAGLQIPGQTGEASNIAQQVSYRALNDQYQPGYFGNQFQAPQQYQPSQFDYMGVNAPELQQYQMDPFERVQGGQYEAPMMGTAQTGFRPDLQAFQMGPAQQVQAGQYATPEMAAAQTQFRPDLQAFQMGPAQQVQGGQYAAPEMAAAQTQFRPDLQAFQMGPAERADTQSFTQPGSAEAYMSPFMQNVVDKQTREAERQAGLAAKQERAQSIQRGAFGGGRTAVREAAAARDLAQLKSDIYGTGQQAAFQNAQQQFNAEQQARMQAQLANQQAGLTTGQQNLAARLGVQQLGTQTGMQTALANLNNQQQAAVQNQAAQLQAQGLTANQAMQAALANQQAGLTVGQQNLASQQAAQQLGTQTGLQAALANLSNQQQAAVQNQAAQLQTQGMSAQQAMQAALANQQAGLTVGQQNLASQQATQQLGTQTGLQAALANLSAEQQANVQNQAARLQTQGLTANQAMQAALANQQAGLTRGQQNLAAQLGIQQLGSGQNMQAQLANQQAYQNMLAQREASRQFGAGQGMTAAQLRAQYGLSGQQLGEQSRQFGAGFGQQGLNTALSGAGQLGQLGQTQFGQQRDIYNLQNQFGGQQRAIDQERANQRYQDYLTEQRHPYQQLEFMSNILRGTPMGTVQTMYNAPPSMGSQIAGLGLAGAGMYGMMNRKKGGTVKEGKKTRAGLNELALMKMGV